VIITVVITYKTQIKEKVLKIKQWVISQECFSLTPLSKAQNREPNKEAKQKELFLLFSIYK
jgi:hypothetical protein